ncbi:MAG: 3-phosphoshikimate 1-carboxyvinyltransferase [Gemmatimonadota bacterium]|nr:3-phosphoshikimate 1-carboxyvinyltransferase [Gemmatimonadota bacterium]
MIVRVPGDKSLTQRALILAALASGPSRLSGLLHGGDAESTARALRALGADIPVLPGDGSEIVVGGVGLRGLRRPTGVLDLGNSGTGARLLMGALAGSGVTATLTGDASLRGRPMARVTRPLTAMGAEIRFSEADGRLPVEVVGRHPLEPIDWPSPVASAQVKSSILLAGLTGRAFALVTEPCQSRDHTERMLRFLGVSVIEHATSDGWRVEMRDPPDRLRPFEFEVPGDVSSAAFVLALAALGGAGPAGVTVQGVGLNPSRTAFLDVLARMGAPVEIEARSAVDEPGIEPAGDVTVRPAELSATSVGGDEIPRLLDELPLIAVLGARAEGVTTIRDAGELRAKESDRIAAVTRNLRALGVEVEEHHGGLAVRGSDRPLSGRVQSFDDHRITMSFGVLGVVSSRAIEIDDPSVASVSFPGFWRLMDDLARAPERAR